MKQCLVFRMYGDIKFNRAINPDKDYISPGGYEFTMGNKTFNFDFEEYIGNIDAKNPMVLHIECKNPDYDTFGEALKQLKKDDLQHITAIPEFFVFTGEEGETDLKPEKLLNLTFVLPYENWENIKVADDVCEKAKLCCNIN